jgi:hypothetical protein
MSWAAAEQRSQRPSRVSVGGVSTPDVLAITSRRLKQGLTRRRQPGGSGAGSGCRDQTGSGQPRTDQLIAAAHPIDDQRNPGHVGDLAPARRDRPEDRTIPIAKRCGRRDHGFLLLVRALQARCPGVHSLLRRTGGPRIDITAISFDLYRSSGCPDRCPAEGFCWVRDQFGPDVLLDVGSGGTDVCTGIAQDTTTDERRAHPRTGGVTTCSRLRS